MSQNSDDHNEMVQQAVIDQIEKVVERSKSQLEKIDCPKHGQALKKLEFNKKTARFNIDTCCPEGEKLVEEAISKII